MKTLLITTLFFACSLHMLCAQDSITKIKIAEIESIVKTIESDTLLKQIRLDNSSSDTLKTGAVRFHPDSLGVLTAFYRNGKLKKVSLQYGLVFFNGGIRQYYYDNDKVIYISDDATNSSRMGSCGTLDIHSYYFLSNYDIISSGIIEEPFECYNTQKKTKEQLFSELAKILERLKGHTTYTDQ